MRGQDQQSRLLYEFCALVLSILRSPPLPVPYSIPPPPSPSRAEAAMSPSPPSLALTAAARRAQVSPAGFASLLLGISLALMLCGSVTFVIGFILMPWILGLVMVLYFVGILSNLSVLGKSILCPAAASQVKSPRKETSGQLFSKLPII